ncbi:MAG TPA: glycoside hydrolase family 2 protein [Clostridiales bacterium]|nr:glycoside hydrolase family 2 protein [Clostridiales bacterium]
MQKVNFNKTWKLWKEKNAFELVFRVPEKAIDVDLPYDAMFHEEQTPDSRNQGTNGFLDGEVYKYYKIFSVPKDYEGKNIIFQFEGIYKSASVYINKSLAGQCAYGYTDFFVKANDYLKYGEVNEMLVVAKCGAMPNSRWYSGGGIYRDTYMHIGAPVYIPPYSLRCVTKEITGDGAVVEITAKLNNDGLKAKEVRAVICIEDGEGNRVLCEAYPVRIKGQDEISFRKNVYLETAKLWSDGHPHLYKVHLRLEQDGQVYDEDRITTGLRKLTLDARHGFRVNGKTVKLRGACIHHDQGILGAATYEDYELRRIRILKEAGFNAVRSAHNPASQALLKACDKLGVYVMDELSDVWTKDKTNYDYALDFERDHEKDVAAMVNADYNHPSVILYSTGNEISDICTGKGFETSRKLGDLFHELDPYRYTTNGINGAFAAGDGLADIVRDITGDAEKAGRGDVNEFMGVMATQMPEIVTHEIVTGILEKLETTMDVLGYNYMTARYLKDAKSYPNRIMVGSETYPKQIAENWEAILQCPAALGDFTWTGWDYMGEVRPVFPELINPVGDIAAIGYRRPVSYYREIVFGLTKQPRIAVQDPDSFGTPREFGPWCYTDCAFNYNYEGKEGRQIMIQVFAGGDEVELFVNGKSCGKQPCGKKTAYETSFHTVYEPGELLAIAYEDGKEIGRTMLRTAKAPAIIHAAAEKDELFAGGESLQFINIQIRDKDHNLVANAANEITIKIEGPASLAAFGSTGAKHDRGFTKQVTTVTDGHALAVLRSGLQTGKVRVTISGEGLQEAVLELEVVE